MISIGISLSGIYSGWDGLWSLLVNDEDDEPTLVTIETEDAEIIFTVKD